jgi:hypothetical protein
MLGQPGQLMKTTSAQRERRTSVRAACSICIERLDGRPAAAAIEARRRQWKESTFFSRVCSPEVGKFIPFFFPPTGKNFGIKTSQNHQFNPKRRINFPSVEFDPVWSPAT